MTDIDAAVKLARDAIERADYIASNKVLVSNGDRFESTAIIARALLALHDERDEWKRLAELRGDEVAKWAHESGTAKGRCDLMAKVVAEADEWLAHLERAGGRYFDGVPGELTDALDAYHARSKP